MKLTAEIIKQCMKATENVAFKFARELENLYEKGNIAKTDGQIQAAIPIVTFAMLIELHAKALENAYHASGSPKPTAESILQEVMSMAMESIKLNSFRDKAYVKQESPNEPKRSIN